MQIQCVVRVIAGRRRGEKRNKEGRKRKEREKKGGVKYAETDESE